MDATLPHSQRGELEVPHSINEGPYVYEPIAGPNSPSWPHTDQLDDSGHATRTTL